MRPIGLLPQYAIVGNDHVVAAWCGDFSSDIQVCHAESAKWGERCSIIKGYGSSQENCLYQTIRNQYAIVGEDYVATAWSSYFSTAIQLCHAESAKWGERCSIFEGYLGSQENCLYQTRLNRQCKELRVKKAKKPIMPCPADGYYAQTQRIIDNQVTVPGK